MDTTNYTTTNSTVNVNNYSKTKWTRKVKKRKEEEKKKKYTVVKSKKQRANSMRAFSHIGRYRLYSHKLTVVIQVFFPRVSWQILVFLPENWWYENPMIMVASARTWPIFFYRYIVPYDDRLSIKDDILVTWGATELTHIPLLMARYTGDALR